MLHYQEIPNNGIRAAYLTQPLHPVLADIFVKKALHMEHVQPQLEGPVPHNESYIVETPQNITYVKPWIGSISHTGCIVEVSKKGKPTVIAFYSTNDNIKRSFLKRLLEGYVTTWMASNQLQPMKAHRNEIPAWYLRPVEGF